VRSRARITGGRPDRKDRAGLAWVAWVACFGCAARGARELADRLDRQRVDRRALEHGLEQVCADLGELGQPGDAGRDQLVALVVAGLELLARGSERLVRGADPAQLALAKHPRDHLPDAGLGLEVLAALADHPGLLDDLPVRELVDQHRHRAGRQPEALAEIGGRERMILEVEHRPHPAHVAAEAPRLHQRTDRIGDLEHGGIDGHGLLSSGPPGLLRI
jgi:hypothetical protein